jgi:hypothetical protein
MIDDVVHCAHVCPECLRFNRVQNRGDDGKVPHVEKGRRMTWGVDLVGPLPVSESGNRWIFTVVDHVTKYVEALALPDKSAATVGRAFWQCVARYGAPAELFSDRGAEFCNMLLRAVCDLLGVEQHMTSGYKPRVNGTTERYNSVIVTCLSKYLANDLDGKNWDLWLPYVCLCLRGRKVESTGYSPYFLMFGEECPLFRDWSDDGSVDVRVGDLDAAGKALMVEVKRRVALLYSLVHVIDPRVTETLNKKKGPVITSSLPPLNPGDFVLLFRAGRGEREGEQERGARKFQCPYVGLYRVDRQLSKGNYKLLPLQGPPQPPMPRERLKPVTAEAGRKLLARNAEEYGREEDEPNPEGEFTVERILRHRGVRHLQYLVKFVGYDAPEWIPEEGIMTYGMIDDYWRNLSVVAAVSGRPSAGRVVPAVAAWVRRRFGQFDLDLFAKESKLDGAKCGVSDFHLTGRKMVRMAPHHLGQSPLVLVSVARRLVAVLCPWEGDSCGRAFLPWLSEGREYVGRRVEA